jgi:Lecithin retinol acyltransferase
MGSSWTIRGLSTSVEPATSGKKPDALVQARTLEEFEGRRGVAEKIEHPGKIFGGLGFWPGPNWEYPPQEVVRRAEALCQVAATKGAYRLSGSNCEHIANSCKCGAHESKQVRYVHAWHAGISFALMLGLGPERQVRTPPPSTAHNPGADAAGAGAPPSTSRPRFWRTATTVGVRLTSRPHRPTVAEPSAEITRDAAPGSSGTAARPSSYHPVR